CLQHKCHCRLLLCIRACVDCSRCFFLLNDPATTEIYTLSLHDALPISSAPRSRPMTRSCIVSRAVRIRIGVLHPRWRNRLSTSKDRKSTRLNSSHVKISYAVFCLKKKKSIHSSQR